MGEKASFSGKTGGLLVLLVLLALGCGAAWWMLRQPTEKPVDLADGLPVPRRVPESGPAAPPSSEPARVRRELDVPAAVPPSQPKSPPAVARTLRAKAPPLPVAINPPPAIVTPAGSLPPAPEPAMAATEIDHVALDKVKLSLRDYRTVMGENPVGTNEEITKALDGGNRRQSKLLPEGASVNGNGQLVDRWSTPYFFHQLSRTDMEIRSAGPDRVLWTEDDIVTH